MDFKRSVEFLGAGTALGAAIYIARRRQQGDSALSACSAPSGRASIYKLVDVDRHDAPSGKKAGPPGQAAATFLTVTKSPVDEIDFAELFASKSPFVLYSIEGLTEEQPFLVFVELSAEARERMWQKEAFIDRGIRKVMELGCRVAVATVASAEHFAVDAFAKLNSGEWGVSFVWNTGRCGSTLMHKALASAGVPSLSEPHWLDQLAFAQSLPKTATVRAMRICVALEVLTTKIQKGIPSWATATRVSFNPKGGTSLPEATAMAYPTAKHAFMYRSCHKVVQSFAGLKFSQGIPFSLKVIWMLKGKEFVPGLGEALKNLPMEKLSSLPVAVLTTQWINTMQGWAKIRERRAKEAAENEEDPLLIAPMMRMDEFASKDMQVRSAVVRTVLEHFGVISGEDGQELLEKALEVYNVHSQEGSSMSGPKADVVKKEDIPVIKECVVASMASFHDVVIVEDAGANLLLKGSLGTS